MPKFMLIAAALLFVMAQVFAPLATAGEAMRSSGDIPQIIRGYLDLSLAGH